VQAKTCPLCHEPGPARLNADSLQNVLLHLAKHLEEISAQALPRAVESDASSVSASEDHVDTLEQEDVLKEALKKYVKQERENFRCHAPNCSKLFKGYNFWRKHIENRHTKLFQKVKSEISSSTGRQTLVDAEKSDDEDMQRISSTCLHIRNLPRGSKSFSPFFCSYSAVISKKLVSF
jgi:hypothetical protein